MSFAKCLLRDPLLSELASEGEALLLNTEAAPDEGPWCWSLEPAAPNLNFDLGRAWDPGRSWVAKEQPGLGKHKDSFSAQNRLSNSTPPTSEHEPRRSGRQRKVVSQYELPTDADSSDTQKRHKRGQPLSCSNNLSLTEDQKKDHQRRIRNRESSRRVRQKKASMMQYLQAQVLAAYSQEQAARLQVEACDRKNMELFQQLQTLYHQLQAALNEKQHLEAVFQNCEALTGPEVKPEWHLPSVAAAISSAMPTGSSSPVLLDSLHMPGMHTNASASAYARSVGADPQPGISRPITFG